MIERQETQPVIKQNTQAEKPVSWQYAREQEQPEKVSSWSEPPREDTQSAGLERGYETK
jgi:hypothetical protein